MMDMHLRNVSYSPGLLFPTYVRTYILTGLPYHQLCGRVPLHPGNAGQCLVESGHVWQSCAESHVLDPQYHWAEQDVRVH